MVYSTKRRNIKIITEMQGGAYDEIKVEKTPSVLKNIVIKHDKEIVKNESSDDRLKKFINFKFK